MKHEGMQNIAGREGAYVLDKSGNVIYLGFLAKKLGIKKTDILMVWMRVPEFIEEFRSDVEQNAFISRERAFRGMQRVFETRKRGELEINREFYSVARRNLKTAAALIYGNEDLWNVREDGTIFEYPEDLPQEFRKQARALRLARMGRTE